MNLAQIEASCYNRSFRPRGGVEWQAGQTVYIGMLFCASETDLIRVHRQDESPSLQAGSCKGGDAVARAQDGGEWLMIRDQSELSPIQELVEAFDSEYLCQCFLLQLRVVLLTLCECARGVGDRAFSAIWVGLRDDCSYSIRRCICCQGQG